MVERCNVTIEAPQVCRQIWSMLEGTGIDHLESRVNMIPVDAYAHPSTERSRTEADAHVAQHEYNSARLAEGLR